MMHAIHICLRAADISDAFDRGKLPRDSGLHSRRGWDLYVNSVKFLWVVKECGFPSPYVKHATAVTNVQVVGQDRRFRVYLNVQGRPELTAVYYVVGWLEGGLVRLDRDPDQDHIVPRRKEAILATKRKNSLISG